VASQYKQWFDVLRSYFAGFSENERDAIFGGTAISVYGL
jgi:L-fuconolactonase